MPPFTLHFHPIPGSADPHGTFSSEEEWASYKIFELKRTARELQAYWHAAPADRGKAAAHLAQKREKVYKRWKELVKEIEPGAA